MRFKSMGGWCGCRCKRWVWEVQWGVNLKTSCSGIWVIKMRIYHESFIFVTGNSYSCTHGTTLNIRLSWDRLTFIMVKHHLHIKMSLGSSAAMMFLFLVVPNIWQWNSNCRLQVCGKNIAIYICHPFSGAVVFESSNLWNVKYLTCDMHLKIQRFCWYWLVDLHFFSNA